MTTEAVRGHDGSRASFLDLPTEIRHMIYRLCLVAREPRQFQPRGTVRVDFKESERKVLPPAYSESSAVDSPTHTQTSDDSKIECLYPHILRLSKQIHLEAAPILYGESCCPIFIIGAVDLNRRPQSPYRWHFGDNLTSTTPIYMKMIRKFVLIVRLHLYMRPLRERKQWYLLVQERLTAFANLLATGHSLRDVEIHFSTHSRRPSYDPLWRCLRRSQNVLQPLLMIYGVRHTPSVQGVTPDFQAVMSSAMTSTTLACVERKEAYAVRMVKGGRGRRPQSYKLGAYYDSRYDVDPKVLSAVDLGSYVCCQNCDW